MSAYSISLFLHIVGALALFAAFGLEWASLSGLRRATAAGQAREWARLQGTVRFVGGPAALTLLVTGIHLSATRWGPQGWIVVGLAGMVVLAVLAALGGRRAAAIAQALPAGDAPIPPAVAQLLHEPVLRLSIALRTSLFLGVVFLMAVKPGTAGALAAIGVALLLGLPAARPAWRSSRRAARVGSAPTGS